MSCHDGQSCDSKYACEAETYNATDEFYYWTLNMINGDVIYWWDFEIVYIYITFLSISTYRVCYVLSI